MTIVTELWIYPVKGLAGISLTEAEVTATGLKWDRHWMVVDDKGRFVSQRQLPQMATVKTELSADSLLLHHPSLPSLTLPLNADPAESMAVKVWDSQLAANRIEAAGQWLTEALQSPRPLHLVRFAEDQTRAVSGKYLQAGEQSHTHFADGYPILLCNQQTLQQLNQALIDKGEQPVPMSRFRGNVIVDALAGAMSELQPWRLTGAQVQLAIRKPCERCPVTKIDQHSGQRMHPQEPLPSLIALNPMADKPGAFFGGNAIVVRGGRLRVGESLQTETD
ncbi:MOSC domain-containing protein [Ferrimonas senticii]|uniref:MOSC domain-containing protein n=1 Tax=Ferrimonas senticii TaxID=394566 RepID=UPI0004272B14|nr:MOSC N-terminal beta barrel domain-containing protein [Ferrimonas senticii]